MPEPNDEVGPYRLLRRLGEGGFGEVWLAERRSSLLAVPVALKLPHAQGVDPAAVRAEATVWLRASGHPNVVPVLDAEEIGGRIVIASEYVAGGSLAGWLKENGGRAPSLAAALRMAEGVLAGLSHLHAEGIVHRDLKPANVLLQAGIPRLADFGLSRVLSASNVSAHLSGSPHYMAPETFTGAYSAASDLWAAGALLFELICGRLPFERADLMQLIAAIRDEPPAELPPDVPAPLQAIVVRLLSRAPEARFATAAEALDALREAMAALRDPQAARQSAPLPADHSAAGSALLPPEVGGLGGEHPGDQGAAQPDPIRPLAQISPPGPSRWHARLMGGLRVTGPEGQVFEPPTRKAAALLARLAYAPGAEMRREALMEMLWPGAAIEQQRNAMSVELHRLRQRLSLAGVPGRDILLGTERLRLDPARVTSDTDRLQRLAEQALACADAAERRALLSEAEALYHSELLAEFDQDWIAPAREQLQRTHAQIAERLVAELGKAGEHDRAVALAQAMVERDRFAEAGHGLLLFALMQAGRPCDALERYEAMERIWREEYGGPPGPSARKLGEEARRRCEAQPAAEQAPAHRAPALPATYFPILGREEEIARLTSLLLSPDCRLVTLTGAGGTGKTRLAIEVARQLVDGFDGRVWFAPLEDVLDAATVVDKLRVIFGAPHVPGSEAIEQVALVLGSQPALIVLDNFDQIAEEHGEVVAQLLQHAPALTCLVTSRLSLQLTMEYVFEVPPLPLPAEVTSHRTRNVAESPCVRLFCQRAQRARPDFVLTADNCGTVVDLCRRLDGIPLAIELAAAWAKLLTPADMLAQLGQILVSRDRGVPRHHRSLAAVIEASLNRLSGELQRFFVRLAVFRGGWTSEAAQFVCSEPLALVMLGELQDVSLITTYQSGPSIRFRMLEPIREFAASHTAYESEAAAIRGRHASYAVQLAGQAAQGLRGPEQADWMRTIEDELPNLRIALESVEPPTRLVVTAAIQPFLTARGYHREGRAWITASPAAMDALPDSDRGPVSLAAGIMAWLDGNTTQARASLNASVAYCRALRDERGATKALINLANISAQEGKLLDARHEFETGLALARRLDDPRLMCGILANLGTLCAQLDDRDAARTSHEEALALLDRYPNDVLRADVLHNLADLDRGTGAPLTALVRIHECMEVGRRLRDRRRAPQTLLLLGVIWVDLREPGRAVRMFAAAEQAFNAIRIAPTSEVSSNRDAMLAIARSALSSIDYSREWEAGSQMSVEQSIEFAIDDIGRWLDGETPRKPDD